jgi:hypothetical protein
VFCAALQVRAPWVWHLLFGCPRCCSLRVCAFAQGLKFCRQSAGYSSWGGVSLLLSHESKGPCPDVNVISVPRLRVCPARSWCQREEIWITSSCACFGYFAWTFETGGGLTRERRTGGPLGTHYIPSLMVCPARDLCKEEGNRVGQANTRRNRRLENRTEEPRWW